ncbi:glycosyltransferase family 2 protein [Haoranjiania flava]|uniref:Glycosyltransferase family 2 protein n=1 Tax=Haoranjiania flava TaxID=1856322 RepID=A0AAE3IL15_9BACT|nr:glycosyltransferase family 2 protein [Haoranjiania flava]MCU7694177.1 glycosyltransferase family 2 protein [Haoranjiania flava]
MLILLFLQPVKLVSIITVNYNQPGVTIEFLRSVKKHAASDNIEIIVADNAPVKDYEQAFREAYADIKYIYLNDNLGFAGGNNAGIRIAAGEFILLLNNDTEITEGFIHTMVETMEQNPGIGMLSPLIKYYDDKTTIQYAGFTKMNYLTARNKAIAYKEKDCGQYDGRSYPTHFCHGAAVMFRKADLKKTGLMHEDYFLYYEEMDWSERFKKAGKEIWFTGKAKIYHKESMSVGRQSPIKTYFISRNRMLFIRRNTSLLNTFLFSIYYTCCVIPKEIIFYLKKGRKDLAKYTLKGLSWNYKNNKEAKNTGLKIFKLY